MRLFTVLLVTAAALLMVAARHPQNPQNSAPAVASARPVPSVASRSRTAVRVLVKRPHPPLWIVNNRPVRLSVTCYVASGQRTASGVWPRVGMAAGNRWPLGTRLLVQRVGVVTVTDRIGHGSQLDVFMASRAACVRFGRQRLAVQVVARR